MSMHRYIPYVLALGLSFYLTPGHAQFAAPQFIARFDTLRDLGTYSEFVDIDRDGKPDCLTNWPNSNHMQRILWGNGSLKFGGAHTSIDFPNRALLGYESYWMQPMRLDADTLTDMALFSKKSRAYLLRQTAPRQFALVDSLFVEEYTGSEVRFSDVDGDGDDDVFVYRTDSTSMFPMDGFTMLRKNEGGHYAVPSRYSWGQSGKTNVCPLGKGAGQDLFIREFYEPAAATSFLYTCRYNGTDFTKVQYIPGMLYFPAAIGDLDGDGNSDILGRFEHWPAPEYKQILFLNASGQILDSVPVPANLNAIKAMDLNGDGKAELISIGATADSAWSVWSVTRASCTQIGMLPIRPVNGREVGSGKTINIADIDGDGLPELNPPHAWKNQGNFQFARPNTAQELVREVSTLIPAQDKQGNNGILEYTEHTVRFIPRSGAAYVVGGPWYSVLGDTVPNEIYAGTVADINGDGKPDALILHNKGVAVLQLEPGATVRHQRMDITMMDPRETHRTYFADADGDGDVDIYYREVDYRRSQTQARLMLIVNTGGGNFAQPDSTGISVSAWEMEILADLNGDGKVDIVTERNNVVFGTGTSFGAFQQLSTPASGSRFAWVDVDGNGMKDQIWSVGTASDPRLRIYFQTATNTFTMKEMPFDYQPNPSQPGGSAEARMADLDQDGNKELIVDGAGQIIAYKGIAGGVDTVPHVWAFQPGASACMHWVYDDWNNDGMTDIVATMLNVQRGPGWDVPNIVWHRTINANLFLAVPKRAQASLGLMVYPNPASRELRFALPKAVLADGAQVRILSQMGGVVKTVKASGNTIRLDGLAEGAYILEVATPKGPARSGFIIHK